MNAAELKNIIWDYTRKIKDNTNKAFNPLCEKYGLTMMQGRILMELYQCAPRTIGSLAESISIAGANLSAMCKKMESDGLLDRVRDRTDERVVQVVLTEKGNRIAKGIDDSLTEKVRNILIAEPDVSLDEIIDGMIKLNDLLSKLSENS